MIDLTTGNVGRAAQLIIFLSELIKEEIQTRVQCRRIEWLRGGVRERAERNPSASVYVHRFPYVVVNIRRQRCRGITTDNRWSGNGRR